jgi:hypothetical protein
MPRRYLVLLACALTAFASLPSSAADLPAEAHAFLKSHCLRCHQGPRAKGKLDLTSFQALESFATDSKRWTRIIARVEAGEMPPVGSKPAPPDEREQFLATTKDRLYAALCAAGPKPGPAPLRRLNRTEYGATIRDLLRIEINLGQVLPDEGAGGEGFDNAAETLFLSPLHAEKYLAAAQEALDYASKNPRSRVALLSGKAPEERRGFGRRDSTPEPDPPATTESARAAIERFLPRAFRRPARESEIDEYVRLYEEARAIGEPFDQALLFALRGILISPHFLFRIEEANATDEPRPVGQYELATRLSYFLWCSSPDDELTRLAAEEKLHDESILREQVARVLNDRRVRESAESFVEQWLGTRELGRNVKPDRMLNRNYTLELEWSLKQEPVLFFQHILAENRPLTDLLDADYTFVDSKLARHYGIRGQNLKQQLAKIDLPDDSHRGGLLGMGGVLAVSCLPHRTSPVLRGKWVRETLLGSPPPPPPPNVPQLDAQQVAATPPTNRQLLEQHRANSACASCHDFIDPIGYGLENYDLLGRWRSEDAGQPIDAQGELPDGTKFNGPAELKQVLLAKKDEFVTHLTRKLLGYALGRGLTPDDHCTVTEIVKTLKENDYRSQVLIAEIVCSTPFRYRAPK